MKRLWALLFSLLLAAFPVLIYLGLSRFRAQVLGLFVLAVLLLRMVILTGFRLSRWKPLLPMFAAVSAVSILSVLFDNPTFLLLVPVMVNVALLVTFALTLRYGPTMIERFAALREHHITPAISIYCRKVTRVWCGFFVLNGAVSAVTVFGTSREYWVLYNGLISYVLIGLLVLAELWVRKRKVAALERAAEKMKTDQ